MPPVFKSAKLVVADSRAEVSSRTRGATASVPAKDVGLRAPAMYVHQIINMHRVCFQLTDLRKDAIHLRLKGADDVRHTAGLTLFLF